MCGVHSRTRAPPKPVSHRSRSRDVRAAASFASSAPADALAAASKPPREACSSVAAPSVIPFSTPFAVAMEPVL
eukprot:4544256-Pleurochrysis_carterae.AAC.1